MHTKFWSEISTAGNHLGRFCTAFVISSRNAKGCLEKKETENNRKENIIIKVENSTKVKGTIKTR
jgi:hypothetical protein